jgi:HEAT repeat protein
VRDWAAAALEDLGPPGADDIVALGRLVGSPNPGIGYWAATLVGRCGADAESTVEPLATALAESPFLEVRQRAAWALGKIGPTAKGAIPALEEAARSDDPRLARLAGQALESIRTP